MLALPIALLTLKLTLAWAQSSTPTGGGGFSAHVEPLNPTPLFSASSPSRTSANAQSTQLAGESPLEHTRINFPTMLDWWVVGALNQAEWTFVEPDADDEDVSLSVLLANLDKTLCPEPVLVNAGEEVRAHWTAWGNVNPLKGAKPGTGYYLILQDAKNASRIYAESENFELRPSGSAPTLIFEVPPNATASAPGAASSTPAGAGGQAGSSAGVKSCSWVAVAAAVAAAAAW